MGDPTDAITVESVSFGYPGPDGTSLPVLNDVSLRVRRGEFVCILGPSGGGKTTLLQIVAGLVRPTAGGVSVPAEPGRLPCTVLFQQLYLFYWADAARNVEQVLRARGAGRGEAHRRAQEYLAQVGLDGFGRHYPHELSGGMQQRLALARVLATDAQTFLLDEPFGNLDLVSERRVEEDFLRIWQERRLSVLMVTHDVRKALRMADRVLVLGPRPASVRAEYPVDLSRPRHGRGEYTPEFLAMEEHLCSEIMASAGGAPLNPRRAAI